MNGGDATDVSQINPEEFAALVKGASDEEILQTVRAAGTETVLERIFAGMGERFAPQKAQGVEADIRWTVTDEGEEHDYVTSIRGGRCEVRRGTIEDPKVGLKTDIVSFLRLLTGQAQGPQLFMAGKLKVSGDLMFSQRITSFFEMPSA